MANVRCLSATSRTIRDHLIRAYNRGPTARCLRDVDVERQHREHFEMSPMVAVEVERATATRNPVGVICGSRRASVVGPQERQARYVLAGGAIPGISQPRITPIKSIS